MKAAPPILPDLEVLDYLGDGGMSTVWKAYSRKFNVLVAVKILRPELMSNREDIELFVSEAQTMAKIDHSGIVHCYDLANAQGLWYYIMEFVDGYTFGSLLARKRHIGEQDCLMICESVAVALDYAWNSHGIVHCDIKPENLMINTAGEVKVTDLGLARIYVPHAAEGVASDQVMGTPAYISPEQVYGDVQLDCRADIYSLAASLYHLAAGTPLFPGHDASDTIRMQCSDEAQAPDPRRMRPELSAGFCQMLEAMLVKNRDGRIQTWRDVYDMCRAVESGASFEPRDGAGFPSSLRLDFIA